MFCRCNENTSYKATRKTLTVKNRVLFSDFVSFNCGQ